MEVEVGDKARAGDKLDSVVGMPSLSRLRRTTLTPRLTPRGLVQRAKVKLKLLRMLTSGIVKLEYTEILTACN